VHVEESPLIKTLYLLRRGGVLLERVEVYLSTTLLAGARRVSFTAWATGFSLGRELMDSRRQRAVGETSAAAAAAPDALLAGCGESGSVSPPRE
jgi:hypothetical protein